jgi:hypothetical protein
MRKTARNDVAVFYSTHAKFCGIFQYVRCSFRHVFLIRRGKVVFGMS